MKNIEVLNAREHNLKDITVKIPQGLICGVCGVSGSGKSTLVKDVIAKTGIMNFAFGLPIQMKGRFFDGKRPDVLSVNNLPPVYLVDIKNANRNIRSTVATVSGLMTIIRNLFCLYNNGQEPRLFSYNVYEADGGGACSNCYGTGTADTINLDLIFGDKSKGIFNGGFKCINQKGIKNTKVTDIFIKAFCKKNNISITKTINELDNNQIDMLLYGTSDIISFTDRTGSNGGKKELPFPGVVGAILDVYNRTRNASIAAFVVEGKCMSCGGTRYNDNALKFKYMGKNIAEFLEMSISETMKLVQKDNNNDTAGLREEYLTIAKELVKIGVGYLNLSRTVSSVSGGELQRIKLAKCLANEVYGGCFVLDEPSTGLHYADLDNLLYAFIRLKNRGNTVIIVEHNLKILENCDYLIEMGENGGSDGGRVLFTGNIEKLSQANTKTGKLFVKSGEEQVAKQIIIDKFIRLKSVTLHNIVNQDIFIPLKLFTTVVGVSGSGKSTAINNALYTALKDYLSGKTNEKLQIDGQIKKVVQLSQEQGVATSNSFISTYLEVMDSIRNLFASLPESQKLGFDKSYYSLNGGKGLCLECNGTGVIKDEDGEAEEVCPACLGKRFSKEILNIKFKGYNIAELLNLELTESYLILKDYIDVTSLKQCIDIGVGYLALNRAMRSLSKGEFQRIRIAKELTQKDNEDNLIILDEPSKGLHIADTNRIISAINYLVLKGNTVIAIEHNPIVVDNSDYVIEFGPGAGNYGGKVVFSGTPADLRQADTVTGLALKTMDKVDKNKINMFESSIKHDECIKFSFGEVKLNIVKDKINVVVGGIGAGKSTIAEKILFSYPFKKYVTMVNTQGKYLTRDIEAIDVGCNDLPISRLISPTKSFFGKNERITQSLNIDYYIAKMFYGFGYIKCEKCGNYSKRIGGYLRCSNCGAVGSSNVIHKNAFSYGKRSCKCPVCKGKGRLNTYDFNEIMNNPKHVQALNILLKDRTRLDRIAPLLRKKFGINLKKKYNEMTAEEKRIFLYGDRKKEVEYLPKNKIYSWTGCNELINTNIQFITDNEFRAYAKKTYLQRICPECIGLGFESFILDVKYKGFSFKEFITSSIKQAFDLLNMEKSCCVEEDKLKEVLYWANEFGLGEIALNDYTINLELGKSSIVQYLKYKFSPLYNTAILWDDFATEKDSVILNKLIGSLENDVKSGNIVILFDKDSKVVNSNTTILKERFHISDRNNNKEMHNVAIIKGVNDNYRANNDIIDRLNIVLYSKTSIGSISGVNTEIKKIFSNYVKKISLSLIEDKCEYCNGKGFYEIDYGLIGLHKRRCNTCCGTGYNEKALRIKLGDLSYPELINGNINTVYNWLIGFGKQAIAKKLEIFKKIGLGYIRLNQGLNEMSYNESSIIFLLKLIQENKGQILYVKNFFIGISEKEQNALFRLIEEECVKNSCKISLIV